MKRGLPTLDGTRISLRSLDEGDLPALQKLFGNPEVVRFMGISLIRSAEDAQSLLDEIRGGVDSRTLFQWGLVTREVDEVIGTCTLATLDWHNLRGEIGFALSPSHRGQGLMTEALRIVLDHAFGALQLHRIEADIDPRNHESIRLVERLGFVREGFMKERHRGPGEWQDSVFFGLLAGAWRRSRTSEDCSA